MRLQTRLPSMLIGLSLLVGCAPSAGGADDPVGRTADAVAGSALFARNCASCHGPAGEGTGTGPSFLSDVYVPGHHADESFQLAVANGARAHHWDFGDMPPVPALDRDDVADIVAHVRALQRAAGLIE